MRTATVKRKTKETDIEVTVNLDGTGVSKVATGIGFFDHMLDLLARHSRIDISVKAAGDLHVDHHHTTEDVGIALGQAVRQALGDMAGITRYASVHMPMDETLSRVAIDISGRPELGFKVGFSRDKLGDFVVWRDRYHVWAFLLGPLWLLWHRLWLAFAAYVVVIAAIAAALVWLRTGVEARFAVMLLVAMLMGYEATSLRRWSFSRGRWH